MFLWLTIMLNTLGTAAPGAVARDAVPAPPAWSPCQAVGTAGYFWLILCAVGESPLVFCLPGRTSQLSHAGSEIQGESITQAKGACRLWDFIAWGDKGSEGGPGEGGAGVLWLARTEQKSIFFASIQDAQLFPALFLQSACSTCFYLTISCLRLTNTFCWNH